MKNLGLTLMILSIPLLLNPPAIAMARAPVYKTMETEYAPTVSVTLADDSDPKMAILDLGFSNPTDNLIRLTGLYFSSKAEVDSASKDAYYGSSYINFWDTSYFASYSSAIYLAPQSNHLHRRLAIRKPAATLSSSDHEPSTYEAIKNGETLISVFSGIVYKTTTYKRDIDYSRISGDIYSADYYADTNQTILSFTASTTSIRTESLDYNELFFDFTFAGAEYQTSGSYSDKNDRPWVSGLHYKEEFTNINVALYKRGDTLQDTSINLTESSSQDFYLNAIPYIVIGGLVLFALALIAGLIVLGIWINKKRQGKNPS
jgi:hypothetical protein